MYGCVGAILIGLCIPADAYVIKILIPQAIFVLLWLSQYVIWPILGDVRTKPREQSHASLGVSLIWLPIPILSGMQAWGASIGIYNPVTDDGYDHSLGYWWVGIGFFIFIGIAWTSAYFHRIASTSDIRFGRFVALSWSTQVMVYYLWALR